MSHATLSVLVTYHNERDLLRHCLESFQNQAAPPDEIIIHDDASNAPAEQFLPDRFRGKIIHSTSILGPARARNVLWRASRGDYVHFHDADDRVLPTWSHAVRSACREGAEMVLTEVRSQRVGQPVSAAVMGLDQWPMGVDLVQFALKSAVLVPSGTYRRRAIEAISGYRESLWQAEDFDFHVRLAAYLMDGLHRLSYRIIREPLVEINLRPHSRSTDRQRVWQEAFKAVQLLSGELPTRYANDLAEAAARVGAQLYRCSDIALAAKAFYFAAQIGEPAFEFEGPVYRRVARSLGPTWAERFGVWYRKLPIGWRESVRECFLEDAA